MPTPNLALRGIREQREMTVRDLAGRAGVSPATVSRIENGHRAASLKTLAALAGALRIEPELIGGLSAERVA